MNNQNTESKTSKFYRFQVFHAEKAQIGPLKKSKTVGMAYLREGQNMYTLKLWTFLNDRFYVLPKRADSSKFLILVREPNQNPQAKSKYFWNIVGNGAVDSTSGVVRLDFDLLEKPVFMSLFPDKETASASGPHLEVLDGAA
jgi:hypothetical protein